MKRASVFAPATIGNVGPGFDVLGVAVEGLGDVVTVTVGVPEDVCVVTGRDAELVPSTPGKNAAFIAARAYAGAAKLDVRVHKGLPLSGGMGGSAASSVGGALAAAHALGKKIDLKRVLAAAGEGEAAVAGWHFDNLAPCLFGGLTLVLPGEGRTVPEIVQLPIKGDFFVALATPNVRVETKTARAVLPTLTPRASWVRQMARTAALAMALTRGDKKLVAASLHDEIIEPARSKLIPGFAEAKAAAMKAGALGCTISGAGPTTFALCKDAASAKRVGKAMLAAYGEATIVVTKLSKKGAYRQR